MKINIIKENNEKVNVKLEFDGVKGANEAAIIRLMALNDRINYAYDHVFPLAIVSYLDRDDLLHAIINEVCRLKNELSILDKPK